MVTSYLACEAAGKKIYLESDFTRQRHFYTRIAKGPEYFTGTCSSSDEQPLHWKEAWKLYCHWWQAPCHAEVHKIAISTTSLFSGKVETMTNISSLHLGV